MAPRSSLLVVSGAALLALTGCGAGNPAPAADSAGPATTVAPAPVASSSPSPAGDGCPVTAAALQQVVDLPAGWRIEASSIECSHGWAQAGVTAPTPEQQGDGVVLFSYDPAAGAWSDKGQGSSVDCAALGVPKRAGRALSVCYYPN